MVRVRKPVAEASYPGNTETELFRAFLIRADQVLAANCVVMDVQFPNSIPLRGRKLHLRGVPDNSPAMLDMLRLKLLDNGSQCNGKVVSMRRDGSYEVELFLGTRSINADLCAILQLTKATGHSIPGGMNSALTRDSKVSVFLKRDGVWQWVPGVVTYADKCQLTVKTGDLSFPIDRKSDRVRPAQ